MITRRILVGVMAAPLFFVSSSPVFASGVTFSQDFESDTPSVTASIAHMAQQGPNDAAVGVTNELAHTGAQSVKFNFNYVDWSNAYTLDKRAEVTLLKTEPAHEFVLGKEYWIGFSEYIPTTWQDDIVSPPNGELIWQFHGSDTGPGEGSPPLAMYVLGGTSRISVRGATTTVYDKSVDPGEKKLVLFNFDADKGKWVNWVINVVFNYSGGKVRVWKNGIKVVDYTGPTMYRSTSQIDETGPYFKIGVYKWAWGSATTWVTNRTLYADDIKIGDATSDCASVTPPGSIICDTTSTSGTTASSTDSTATSTTSTTTPKKGHGNGAHKRVAIDAFFANVIDFFHLRDIAERALAALASVMHW